MADERVEQALRLLKAIKLPLLDFTVSSADAIQFAELIYSDPVIRERSEAMVPALLNDGDVSDAGLVAFGNQFRERRQAVNKAKSKVFASLSATELAELHQRTFNRARTDFYISDAAREFINDAAVKKMQARMEERKNGIHTETPD